MHMRALSITSLLIQACIVSVAMWPDRIGAEEKLPAAFRIEISQPEYSPRTGGTWVCSTEQLVRSECRHEVPLIIFGEPTLAQIQVGTAVAPSKRRAVVVYASLDHPRGWYRASGGRPGYFYLALNTDGSLAKEIRLQYEGERPGSFIYPVVRPSPQESLALKITPVAAR
jgi:hypothetical protein